MYLWIKSILYTFTIQLLNKGISEIYLVYNLSNFKVTYTWF